MVTNNILQKTAKGKTYLKYSAVKFRQYFLTLKAKCAKNLNSCTVLNGSKDPVTKFLARNKAIKSALQASQSPSEQQIFDDPQKHLTDFLQNLENKLSKKLDAEEALAEINANDENNAGGENDVEEAEPANAAEREAAEREAAEREARRTAAAEAVAHLRAVYQVQANFPITAKKIDELEKKVQAWLNGEAYIYAIAVDSLRAKTALIVKTPGAGRKQLKKLQEKHNTRTPKTTETMIYVWDNMTIMTSETVEDFRERWDELIEDMKDALPEEPEILGHIGKEKILMTYPDDI